MRSISEFREKLAEQLDFLRVSNEEYDRGNRREGIRISQALRVIFHDTSNSTSLLQHLNAKRIRILSTSPAIPRNAKFWFGLVNIRISPAERTCECVPKLAQSSGAHFVWQYKWWEEQPIFLSVTGRTRRKTVVLDTANTDGGAHVAEVLKADYRMLKEGLGFSMKVNPVAGGEHIVNLQDAHLASLRQMSYEVLNSPEIAALAK